jgi:hypothetical protein
MPDTANNGIEYPIGAISMKTVALNRSNRDYRAHCKDIDVTGFIRCNSGFNHFLERASVDRLSHYEDGNFLFTPVVINRVINQQISTYIANLLVPPNVGQDRSIMLPSLVVPALEIVDRVESGQVIKGYVLRSSFTGSQRFYFENDLNFPLEDESKYQGFIAQLADGPGQFPKIRIRFDSKSHPGMFQQNKAMLDQIAESGARFWWNIKL